MSLPLHCRERLQITTAPGTLTTMFKKQSKCQENGKNPLLLHHFRFIDAESVEHN